MAEPEEPPPVYGRRYGKRDLDRNGQFAEMSYLIGEKWTPLVQGTDIRDLKKPQMYSKANKIKAGLQDCYFEKEFHRLFIGEGIPWRISNEPDYVPPYMGPVWYPPKKPIKMRFRGDYHGTFAEKIPSFSPRIRMEDEWVPEERGIFTNPGKKGGPGYVDITISRYPVHLPCPYNPPDIDLTAKSRKKRKKDMPILDDMEEKIFLPPFVKRIHPGYFNSNPYRNTSGPIQPYKKFRPLLWTLFKQQFKPSNPSKLDGGCKDGTLNKFPPWMPDLYIEKRKVMTELEAAINERWMKMASPKERRKEKKRKGKKKKLMPFKLGGGNKTMDTYSILSKKVNSVLNEKTWQTMRPVTFIRQFALAK